MAIDYNPDKERHVDHTFVVSQAEPVKREGVETSRGLLKFDQWGRFAVKDEALAREIQKSEGRRVAVTRFRTPHPADRGHRYHFGQMPALPWARYDELGRRIREEEDAKQAAS